MVIAGREPDIIMVTEVIPKAQVSPLPAALLSLPGYNLYTNFNTSQANLGRSGSRGVCIFIKERLLSTEVSLYNSTSFEQLWVVLTLQNEDRLLVGCVYFSPSSNRQLGLLEFDAALKAAIDSNMSHLLVAGDFNVPHIDWSHLFSSEAEGHFSHTLIQIIQDHFLTQHVTEPTRYRPGHTPSMLDLILTNEEGMVHSLRYLPGLGSSDHVILEFVLMCYSQKKAVNSSLNFNRGDYDMLRTILQEADWSALAKSPMQQAYDIFMNTLQQAVGRSIPKSRPRRFKNLYMNGTAARLKHEKNIKWKKYIHSQDPVDYARFCQVRNKLRSLTRKLRACFEQKLATEIKQNPKAFWKYSNSRLKTKLGIESIRDDDGNLSFSDEGKAVALNRYFASVFCDENLATIPDFTPLHQPLDIEDLVVTKDMVRVKLLGLKATCSPGPDQVHPRVVREASDQLAEPLAILFNKSLNTGTLPVDWKQGSVVPIYKKGDRSVAGNYRPVSLTSILCKVLESLVKDHIMSHLDEGQLLSRHQHGFRPGRSCTSQLLETINDWTMSIEKGTPVDAIYLDFKKAFDSVPHQRLIRKVEGYGIRGKLRHWISSFLSNRCQQVVIGGCVSPWSPVLSGVPQGSVLGPTLFMLYINDLPDMVYSSVKIFADDTKIYRPVSQTADSEQLQKDLETISAWSDKWQLPFNGGKCKSLHVGPRNASQPYQLHGVELEQLSAEKDLGIIMDTELKFRKQAAAASAKGNQMLALLKRSFMCIDSSTLPLLYKALVRPHLEYGNLIWGPFNRTDEKLIERVQRRASKLVKDIRHLTYQERLRILNLPSLYHRRRRGDMIAISHLPDIEQGH